MRGDLGFLVSLLIISMDISAAVLGIEAEIAQNKAKHRGTLKSGCVNPNSGAAFDQGIAAVVLLGLAHLTANVLGGCVCFHSKQEFKKSSADRILAVAFLILSWMLLAVGISMMIIGALANSRSKNSCSLPHRWLFLIGGIFCVGHGLVAAAYYVSATTAAREEPRPEEQERQIHGVHE